MMASQNKEGAVRARGPCACIVGQEDTGFDDDVVMHDASTEEADESHLDDGLPSSKVPKDILSITIEQDHFDFMKMKNKLLLARFLEVEEDKKKAEEAGVAVPSQRKQLSSSTIRRSQRKPCQATQNSTGTGRCRWGKNRMAFLSQEIKLKIPKRFHLNLRVHLSEEMGRTVYMHLVHGLTDHSSSLYHEESGQLQNGD